MKNLSLTLLFYIALTSPVFSQDNQQTPTYKRSLGSSVFMLGNLAEDSPDFVLLTYGYKLTDKDRIYTEFNTWKYSEPLGTYGHSEEFYPGYVRSFGIGFGYQRFFWNGLYGAASVTPTIKYYNVEDNSEIQTGFQLYTQLITGYRFEFFKERFYIEPAIALKYWPVNTNTPTEFTQIDAGTPEHIFEPSLNIGIRF